MRQAGATLHRGARASHYRGLLLRNTGFRRAGSVVVAHGPSCSAACGILPDQGSSPSPLHWQADSQPLRHQGSPALTLLITLTSLVGGNGKACRGQARKWRHQFRCCCNRPDERSQWHDCRGNGQKGVYVGIFRNRVNRTYWRVDLQKGFGLSNSGNNGAIF